MKKAEPIFLDTERKQNALVGHIYEDDKWYCFMKRLRRETHFMRVNECYGIQEIIYQRYLLNPPVNKQNWVWIFEEDTKHHLLSPMKLWGLKGRVMKYNEMDGKQRFLGEKFMSIVDDINAAIKRMREVEQLPLVEG